jgi:monovalent cation/hydrogen antiporter
LPAKLITLIEGEGLLNDATALTTFTVAVAAVSSGNFSIWATGLRFVVAAAGGLLVGTAVAYAIRLVKSWVNEPVLVNSVSLATPFGAYLLGEELRVSGVLAVVVAGLIVGHDTPRFASGSSRLQTSAVWRLVDLLLEGFTFLLIGQQVGPVLRGLKAYSTSTIVTASAVTLVVVLLARPLWLVITQSLPRALHTRLGGGSGENHEDRRLTDGEVLIMSWAGTRGVITLAAIFSLPLSTRSGAEFPGRDLLLFCAYLVVLVTLVGQGMTFAPIVHAVGLRADAADAALTRSQAREAAVEAALARVDQLSAEGDTAEEILSSLQTSLNHRLARCRRRLDALGATEDGEVPISADYEAALRARRAVIDAQRDELLRWRDSGRLPDSSLRILERELDHEEHTLPARRQRRAGASIPSACERRYCAALDPPSMAMVCPVIDLALSEARNSASAAMPSGLTKNLSDWMLNASAVTSSKLRPLASARPRRTRWIRSPLTAPGAMALTRIPALASSMARVSASPSRPRLVVAYGLRFG